MGDYGDGAKWGGYDQKYIFHGGGEWLGWEMVMGERTRMSDN